MGVPLHQTRGAKVSCAVQGVLGSQMYWLVWVALAGVGIGAGMTFVPSLPALMHATRTLVGLLPSLNTVCSVNPCNSRRPCWRVLWRLA